MVKLTKQENLHGYSRLKLFFWGVEKRLRAVAELGRPQGCHGPRSAAALKQSDPVKDQV
jgi:hypothetical protein